MKQGRPGVERSAEERARLSEAAKRRWRSEAGMAEKARRRQMWRELRALKALEREI